MQGLAVSVLCVGLAMLVWSSAATPQSDSGVVLTADDICAAPPFDRRARSLVSRLHGYDRVLEQLVDHCPDVAMLFAEFCHDAGIPPGVFNLVMGPGASVGSALVDDPHVRALSFTGSVPTGRRIAVNGLDWWKREGEVYTENWVFVDMVHLFRQFGVDLLARARAPTTQQAGATR